MLETAARQPTTAEPGGVSRADDPAEVAAERTAQRVLSRGGTQAVQRAGPASGAGLDPQRLAFFERRFAARLDDVRLHTDATAADRARDLGARAFTRGTDISFGAGAFAPQTAAGASLLAHELAHVVRQRDMLEDRGRIHRQVTPPDEVSGPVSQAPLTLATEDEQAQICIAPVDPPPLPQCLPSGLDLDIPTIGPGGEQQGESRRRVEFEDEILDSSSVVLYAVPLASLDVVHDDSRAVCEPGDEPGQTLVFGPPANAPGSPFAPALVPPWKTPDAPVVQPAPVSEPAPLPPLEALSLRGDYAITARHHTLAVGAGSVRVVRTKNGISLIDAGVGPHAHSEITAEAMKQLRQLIGDSPINEVLLTHLHEDHTSLLPELAAEFRIGTIRVNAYQLQDPRMLKVLVEVSRKQARRIGDQVRQEADPKRSAWEADPDNGVLKLDPPVREARWHEHVNRLVEAELARSAIRLENLFVNKQGELHVVKSPILGELTLPKTESAPVLLERGLLESDSTTGTRVSTVHPKFSQDLDALIKRQQEAAARDPQGKVPKAPNEYADANETTYVLEFDGGFRLFVTPDKRAPDVKAMESLLRGDVARLNAELARLGRKPARLQVWDITHHAQKGFVTDAGEVDSLIEGLHELVRVKHASGGVSADVVIVSGHPTLIDPLTIWLMEELKIQVIVATSKTVDLLEVVLRPGETIAGVSQAPYRTGVASAGLLRGSETAVRAIDAAVEALTASRPVKKGMKAAEYRQKSGEITTQIEGLEKLKREILAARKAYVGYYESRLRPAKDGAAAPGIAPDDPVAAARRTELETLLADERIKGAVAEAAPATPVFDPVAMTLLKEPASGFTEAQRKLADAIVRTDTLREQLRTTDTVDNRAAFATELTRLKPLIAEYLKTAPEGTKQLLERNLADMDAELAQVTKPVGGGGTTGAVSHVTTPDGAIVEQRTRFTKADRVRQVADLTTRPMGAIMIYSMVKRKEGLTQQYLDEQIDLPEYLIGTAHSAYGVTVGVRMLHKVHVSNTEFVVLAVLDVLETSTHRYATEAQRRAAFTYSLVRNGLNVALQYIGGAMMRSRNAWVAAAGFALQFAVDPFLEWIGLYDWLERKYDFMPDEVAKSRQHIEKLMKDYTVLIGLLELAERPTQDADLKAKIAEEVKDYRGKVTAKERDLLKAFDDGYDHARLEWAGLPELDLMREQFVQLQYRAHQGDTENVVRSRKQILDATQATEAKLSMDHMTAEQIRGMKQWDMIDSRIGVLRTISAWLRRKPRHPDWAVVRKHESELAQMMDNARYRLDPTAGGLRHSPLLTPGTEARTAYEQHLFTREAIVARLHEQLLGVDPIDPTLTPLDAATTRAERLVTRYGELVAAVPPFQGLDARRLEENSYDLAKTYVRYLDDHRDFRQALEKLQTAELVMQSAASHLDIVAAPVMSEQVSSFERTRVEVVHERMAERLADRVKRGYLFPDEAKQRAIDVRVQENRAIAAKLGEKDAPMLSSPARTAIIERGLKISTVGTIADRLNAMPMLSRVGADGYMVGVYRYVDRHMPESQNALVGDLRRTAKVPGLVDEKVDAHLYVPLNPAADRLWGQGHWFMHADPIIGRSIFADVPNGTIQFDDDEVEDNLQRVRFEELHP